MSHTSQRRMMIAMIAAIGSLLAVTAYIEGGIPEKNVTHADQQEVIEPTQE